MEKQTTDILLEEFHLPETEEKSELMVPMTLWVPAATKAKYQLIQERSKRKFSKHLVKVLKCSIDKVKIEDEAC